MFMMYVEGWVASLNMEAASSIVELLGPFRFQEIQRSITQKMRNRILLLKILLRNHSA